MHPYSRTLETSHFLLVMALLGAFHCSTTEMTRAENPRRNKQDPTPAPAMARALKGHGGTIESLAFHPRGDLLYSGGHDAQVIGWNIAKINTRRGDCFEVDRRQAGERISSLAFNRNGNVLAVSGVTHWGNGFGSAMKIYTPYQDKPFVIGAASAWSYTSCDVDPGGKYVVMGGRKNLLRAVALTTKKTRKNKIAPALARVDAPRVPGPVLRVACHPYQPIVAAGGTGGWISTYEITKSGFAKRPGPTVLIGDRSKRVHGLRFTPDGDHLIVAFSDGNLGIFETETGKQIRKFELSKSTVNWIDVHPEYPWIVCAHADGVTRIVNYETEKELAEMKGAGGEIKTAVFSPSGKFLATGGEDQIVRIWDLEISK